MSARSAFTFIEVIAIMLVVALGLASVIGLVFFGVVQAGKSKASQLGMPTAISIAIDPQPLLDAPHQASWTYTPLNLDGTGDQTSSAHGIVNGFYVVRSEQSTDQDVIAREGGTTFMRSSIVQVDVYDSLAGSVIASFTTRLIHQRGSP